MKAITFNSYGPPDVLQITDLPEPQPGPGQVRVRVKVSGVQPFDCAVRSGWFAKEKNPFPIKFHQVLGNQFTGIVDEAGDNVSEFTPGDKVLGWESLASYAEYVVVPANQIINKPDMMPWKVAGAGQAATDALNQKKEKQSLSMWLRRLWVL